MPGHRAKFTAQELKEVLSHYDIGQVNSAKHLEIGNRLAPKCVIETNTGRYFLKRRQKGKDDILHVAFAHEIELFLENRKFDVPGLIPEKKGKTALKLSKRIYEMFNFIDGIRYDSTLSAAKDAGKKLALLHIDLEEYKTEYETKRLTFHNSSGVRRHLKTIASQKFRSARTTGIRQCAADLMTIYNQASVTVNELGFDNWQKQIIHSDWHPGNMLFNGHKVAAVLDFEAVKQAPRICDVGNGALQFSIIGGQNNPNQWPEKLDKKRLNTFLNGYRSRLDIDEDKLKALPWLMIETMIAESVLPIATTGFFGHFSGVDFLKMILRKCRWIYKNKNHLIEEFLLS